MSSGTKPKAKVIGGPPATAILVDDAQICDGPAANHCHPLASQVILQAGPVKVIDVQCTRDCPVAAWFIPADESATYPHNSATVTGAAAPFTWTFSWSDLPALGLYAILRLQELPTDGMGDASDYTVHMVSEPAERLSDTEID